MSVKAAQTSHQSWWNDSGLPPPQLQEPEPEECFRASVENSLADETSTTDDASSLFHSPQGADASPLHNASSTCNVAWKQGSFDEQIGGLVQFLEEESRIHSDIVWFLAVELQITSVSDLAHYWTLDSYEAELESEVVAHIDALKSKPIAKLQTARLRAAWKTARQKNAAVLMGIGAHQPKLDFEQFLLQCRVDSAVIAHMKENLLMETVDDFVHYWTASETHMGPTIAQVEPFRNMWSSERFTIEVACLSYGSTRLVDVTWSISTEEIETQQGTFTVVIDPPKKGRATLPKLMLNECRCAGGGFVHIYVPIRLSSLYVIEEPALLPFSLLRSLTMGHVGQKQERVLNVLRRIEGWHEGLEQRIFDHILEGELTQSMLDTERDGKWRMILTDAEKSNMHLARALIMTSDFILMNHPTKHSGINDVGLTGMVLREDVHNQTLFKESEHMDCPRKASISCDHKWTTGLAGIRLLVVSANAAGKKSSVNKLDASQRKSWGIRTPFLRLGCWS